MNYLDSVVISYWTLNDVVRTYIDVDNYITKKEKKDLAYGKNENYPIPFSLIEEGSGINITSYTGFPLNHIIQVNSSFLSLEKPIQRFLLLRECGHLEHWDTHVQMIAKIVTTVAAVVFFRSAPLLGYLALNTVVPILLNAIQERRADSYAITHASTEELEGAISFYKEEQMKRPDLSELDESDSQDIVEAIIYYIRDGHSFESTRIAALEEEIELRKNNIIEAYE
jgi:hypothetical protein